MWPKPSCALATDAAQGRQQEGRTGGNMVGGDGDGLCSVGCGSGTSSPAAGAWPACTISNCIQHDITKIAL